MLAIAPYAGISDARYAILNTLWLSPTGSDANNGLTPATARAGIASTIALAAPGTAIRLLPGTYQMGGSNGVITNGGNADTLVGYIAIISDTPHAAKLVPASTGAAFNVLDITQGTANYIILDGLDIQGPVAGPINGNALELKNGHHYKILNCLLRDSAACGLQTNAIDYLLVDGCSIYGNAKTNTSHCSGVSMVGPVAYDALPGFHYVIRNSMIYGNTEGSTISGHTDGNGVICDTWNQHAYTQQALFENNLIFKNGNRGIELLYASNVTVRNNTLWHNAQDSLYQGWTAELATITSPGAIIINNILSADLTINAHGVALAINNDGNSSVVASNLTFNGTAGQPSYGPTSTTTTLSVANGNKIGVDPMLAMPGATPVGSDFHAMTGSPAKLAGGLAYGFAQRDTTGAPRLTGCQIDIGACQGVGR